MTVHDENYEIKKSSEVKRFPIAVVVAVITMLIISQSYLLTSYACEQTAISAAASK